MQRYENFLKCNIFNCSNFLGDSGGPLTTKIDGKDVLIGVTSFGARVGCKRGYPARYSRVSYFLDWIDSMKSEFEKVRVLNNAITGGNETVTPPISNDDKCVCKCNCFTGTCPVN